MRRWLGLLICFLGIGAVDQVFAAYRKHSVSVLMDGIRQGVPGQSVVWNIAVQNFGHWLAVMLICLVALAVAFPKAIRRDEHAFIWAACFAFAFGRSALGVGEGFSTDLLFLSLTAMLAALLLRLLWNFVWLGRG